MQVGTAVEHEVPASRDKPFNVLFSGRTREERVHSCLLSERAEAGGRSAITRSGATPVGGDVHDQTNPNVSAAAAGVKVGQLN